MSRLQLALNVDDLEQSIAFYTGLFGTEPAKVKPGYANFAVADPALKLVLIENPGHGGSINHLGVEVADTDTVDAEQSRLAEVGLASVDERDSTCCYARQDKFWVEGAPNGEQWEIYTVLEDAESFGPSPPTTTPCRRPPRPRPAAPSSPTGHSTYAEMRRPGTGCTGHVHPVPGRRRAACLHCPVGGFGDCRARPPGRVTHDLVAATTL